jgi:hypothetical protein
VLLREEGDAVIVIGQASHAWVSGQLARAWGNDAFPSPRPPEEVWLAALQHDIGMSEWDRHPSLNPQTGLPDSFMEMPLATHIELWRAAPAKLETQSRYAALLVSLHGTALYQRRDLDSLAPAEAELVRGFLKDSRRWQAAVGEALGLPRDELERNQRLLATWDGLSLALCLPWPDHTLRDVPGARGPADIALSATGAQSFTLSPWPFSTETVHVRCEGHRLDGRFDTEAELHGALERAPGQTLEFTLTPR